MDRYINVKALDKSYGSHHAIKGISFYVNKGEAFALLGTNGAGKTTTLECLEGIRRYDGGSIELQGRYGVQLQSSSLPHGIKALEAIKLFAKWSRTKVDMEYISRLGIDEFKNKQYSSLSTGQKRRLHLAIALLGDPDIVFLDEPTAGLDVEGRISIHNEIKRLKALGKSIIMASHDMAEVEELCDRIAILKDGTLAFIGTAQELAPKYKETCRMHIKFSAPFCKDKLVHSTFVDDQQGYSVFDTESLTDGIWEVTSKAKEQGVSIRDIAVEKASLEDSFMAISKQKEVV